MTFRRCCLVALLVAALWPLRTYAQVGGYIAGETHAETLAWRKALKTMIGTPGKVDLAGQATLTMTGSMFFIPHDPAAEIIHTRHEPEIPDLVGIILDSNASDWFIVIRFIDGGFVRSDEFQSWSASQLLFNLDEKVQAESTLTGKPQKVRRWLLAPIYDPRQHSLIWSEQIVPKTAAPNENGEATYHAAAFGRQGYFRFDMNAVVDHPNGQAEDAAAVVGNLHFNDGRMYEAFDPAADPVALHGLPGVFGLTTLHSAVWFRKVWRSDLLVPAAGGLALVMGAAAVFLVQIRIARARNQRVV